MAETTIDDKAADSRVEQTLSTSICIILQQQWLVSNIMQNSSSKVTRWLVLKSDSVNAPVCNPDPHMQNPNISDMSHKL
jgi:hypothetical protein